MNNILIEQCIFETARDIFSSNDQQLIENLIYCFENDNFDSLDSQFFSYFFNNYNIYNICEISLDKFKKVYKTGKHPGRIRKKDLEKLRAARTVIDSKITRARDIKNADLVERLKHNFSKMARDRSWKNVGRSENQISSKFKKLAKNAIKSAAAVRHSINSSFRKKKSQEMQQQYVQNYKDIHDLHKKLKSGQNLDIEQKRKIRKKLEEKLIQSRRLKDKHRRMYGRHVVRKME